MTLAGFLITLFTVPTYRAVVAIPLPDRAGVDFVQSQLALARSPRVLSAALAPSDKTPPVHADVSLGTDSLGRHAILLAIEGEDPEAIAQRADAWEQAYATSPGALPVAPHSAEVPTKPVRPRKTQNILFSALVGLFIGFALVGMREAARLRRLPTAAE